MKENAKALDVGDERTDTADTNNSKKSAKSKLKKKVKKAKSAISTSEAAILSLLKEKALAIMKQSKPILELLNGVPPEVINEELANDKIYQSCMRLLLFSGVIL